MLENVYEGLNAQPKVYLSKDYFCEMYPTCVSSKLCEFIYCETILCNHTCASDNQTLFESASSVFVSRVKVSMRPSKAAISTALGESPSWASGSSLCVQSNLLKMKMCATEI